jgi:zinc protease
MWKPALLLLIIIIIGTVGYYSIENMSILDSLYMTTITIFTVGFREVKPLSPIGQLFTILIIGGGVGTAIFAFTKVGEIIEEGGINKFWRRRRMEKRLKKSRCVLSLILLMLIISFSAKAFSQEEPQTKLFDLENGMRVFLYERHNIPLINCAFAFNIGSKDESAETSGLVHILEHYILFRGTEFRTGEEISQDIRKHGAYVNAHTEYDLSIFEISLPSEYADFALSNHKEILYHLKLTKEELDEEKEVILEEINQIHDDPMKYATSLAYQNLFHGHPYERPIYGRREVIETVTVDKIQQFYEKHFVPSNCALVIVGDFEIREMEDKVRTIFSDLEGEPFQAPGYEMAMALKDKYEIEEEMDVNMAYLVLGYSAPHYNDPDQFAVDLLAEILGRGINPMLNHPLLERRIYVNSINMSYSAHKFGGAILIYFVMEPKYIKTAKNRIIRYLKQTRDIPYSKKDHMSDTRFYATDYLESAKNRIKFNIHSAQENGLAVANSYARHMHMSEDTIKGNFLDNIENVDSSEIRKAAGNYLTKNDYVIVTIMPKEKDK